MRTDAELQRSLHATFAHYGASVTHGPTWDPARVADGSCGADGSGGADWSGGDGRDLAIEMTQFTDRTAARRWRAPVLIAASVAVVAVATSAVVWGVAGGPNRIDTADSAATSGGVVGASPIVGQAGTAAGAPGTEATSAQSTATIDAAGVITVAHGDPNLVLDVYQDALCPSCAVFESRHGAAISHAITDGTIAVRYHLVDFLNPNSASGTYSTRAYAALMSVARHDGGTPGVFAQFYATLFTAAIQPDEFASADLSNGDLAAIAADAGASEAAQQAIAAGAAVENAKADAEANMAKLADVAARAGRRAGTPTVAVDGQPVDIRSGDWLADLVAHHR